MERKRSTRRALKVGVVATAAALLLSACSDSSDDASGDKSYQLAFMGALTGDDSSLGINGRDGAKVAIKQFNDANPGMKVTLKEYDSQGDPAQASTIKDQFVNDAKTIGLIGPMFSGETKAILPSLQQNGLVMVSPSATNVALPTVVPDQTVFHRVLANDDAQGKGIADYVIKTLKAKKIAFIHDNTEYGKGLADGIAKMTTAGGVTTVATDTVDPKGQDYSAAVNKTKVAKPDVVFYGGYYAGAGRLRKQLVDGGVTSTFIAGDGSLDPGFIDAGGAQANGAQLTCPCNVATAASPGALGTFVADYKTIINTEPGTYSTEGYDAAKILLDGIKAGNTTRPALLNYVETLPPYTGISKQITFEPDGDIVSTAIYFFEVKDGKLSPLGSSDTLIK